MICTIASIDIPVQWTRCGSGKDDDNDGDDMYCSCCCCFLINFVIYVNESSVCVCVCNFFYCVCMCEFLLLKSKPIHLAFCHRFRTGGILQDERVTIHTTNF